MFMRMIHRRFSEAGNLRSFSVVGLHDGRRLDIFLDDRVEITHLFLPFSPDTAQRFT